MAFSEDILELGLRNTSSHYLTCAPPEKGADHPNSKTSHHEEISFSTVNSSPVVVPYK